MGCNHIDSFVHRSGRTGRVGKEGTNILFFEKEDISFILEMEKSLNINLNIVTSLMERTALPQLEEQVVSKFTNSSLKSKLPASDLVEQITGLILE